MRNHFFLALVEFYVHSFSLLKTETFDRAPGEYRVGNRILVENWETRIIHIVPVVKDFLIPYVLQTHISVLCRHIFELFTHRHICKAALMILSRYIKHHWIIDYQSFEGKECLCFGRPLYP